MGVNYRRIPVLSIGRDFYCDTLLILEKLEALYPSSEYKQISATNPTEKALEHLLEKWTDVVVFQAAARVISTDLDLMKDPQFQKDREELWGRAWSKEAQDELRPKGMADIRANFDFLEECLSDGREWLMGNEGPMLADIHAGWIFDWLFQLPGSYDEAFFNEKTYPKTYAWLERYKNAIAAAKERAPKPSELEGKDAIKKVLSSPFTDDVKVEKDPLGLQEGDEVEMFPKDTGYDRKDSGKLVGLNAREAVVEAKCQDGSKEVRIHYPRWNFEIVRRKAEMRPRQAHGGSFEGTDHVG
jgi:glutathione S-transferase